MMTIRTCFSRSSVFKKLQFFDLHSSVHCYKFSYNLRPYHKHINEKVEDRFRSEDSVSKDYRIIYRAPYVNYIKLSYGFTTISTSIVVPVVGSALMTAGIGNYPVMMGDVTLLANSFEFTALFGIIMLVMGQIGYVVFKYPFRIYHNSINGKYIAVYQHLLPWKKHKEEFFAGEVKKVDKSYSIWHECLFEIRNKRAILLEDHFYLPQDFNDMLTCNTKKDT